MEMKKLRVVTARMAGYTGVLGPVRFKDGVSEEYLPRHIRDRMGAALELMEVDQDGNEQPAGPAHRLIRQNQESAQLRALERQTPAEKQAELTQNAVEAAPKVVLLTKESLEEIAGKTGMKGLREVAAKWNVKHRTIPVLIQMILDAQDKAIAARNKKLQDKMLAEADKLKTTSPQPASVVEGAPALDVDGLADAAKEQIAANEAEFAEQTAEKDAAKEAAATGDLSAAINADQE